MPGIAELFVNEEGTILVLKNLSIESLQWRKYGEEEGLGSLDHSGWDLILHHHLTV